VRIWLLLPEIFRSASARWRAREDAMRRGVAMLRQSHYNFTSLLLRNLPNASARQRGAVFRKETTRHSGIEAAAL
jgi:hypothetical protein